jgi:hypothetical protein
LASGRMRTHTWPLWGLLLVVVETAALFVRARGHVVAVVRRRPVVIFELDEPATVRGVAQLLPHRREEGQGFDRVPVIAQVRVCKLSQCHRNNLYSSTDTKRGRCFDRAPAFRKCDESSQSQTNSQSSTTPHRTAHPTLAAHSPPRQSTTRTHAPVHPHTLLLARDARVSRHDHLRLRREHLF